MIKRFKENLIEEREGPTGGGADLEIIQRGGDRKEFRGGPLGNSVLVHVTNWGPRSSA